MSTRLVIRKTKYSTDELFIKAKKSPKYSPNTVKRLVTRKDGVTQSYWVGLGEHIESRMKAGMKFWQAQIALRAFDRFRDISQRHKEPIQVKEYQSIEESKSDAMIAQDELTPLIEHWANITGGEPQPRKFLKSNHRIQQKLDLDYGGKVYRVVDIAGGRIVYKNMNRLYRGLAILLAQEEFVTKVVRFKDRFLKPALSQYRDLLFNLQMSKDYIVEFRLEIKDFNQASDGEEHDYYEESREIYHQAKLKGRPLNQEEKERVDWLSLKSKAIYTDVWKRVKMNNYKEVRDE